MDIGDEPQKPEMDDAIEKMFRVTEENGFQDLRYQDLPTLVHRLAEIFRVYLSTGPAALFNPLRIKPTADALPVSVRHRNSSQ